MQARAATLKFGKRCGSVRDNDAYGEWRGREVSEGEAAHERMSTGSEGEPLECARMQASAGTLGAEVPFDRNHGTACWANGAVARSFRVWQPSAMNSTS